MSRNALLNEIHPDDRRSAYAAMANQTLLADNVSVEPVCSEQTAGYWLRPKKADPDRVIMFVHGGGYHLGSAKSYLGFVSQIAAATNCTVFSVDYALAPERPFPNAFHDVLQSGNWLVRQGIRQVALMGDSAGGGLVLAALNQRFPDVHVASVVVFSPWTDLACTGQSFADISTQDPVFKPQLLKGLAESYLDGASPKDPRASPLYEIPETCPPLLVQVGTDELLLDDARRYADRAAQNSVRVRLEIYEGMFHVFQRDHGSLKTAKIAIEQAAEFVELNWADWGSHRLRRSNPI